ncbi:hypothetical protein CF327_g6574 [Tilletia walkeri]|uniref:Uncharacterized protein n=1 Tax=Tilletia walkeri TaxID=117179 RepID=A0A8X7N4W1_9BASI|nr:hypothetical protein CF327_g6574 [Tilletia walkeri]KAE8266462.1 hypothetical protein A4X09_0g5887 [Tilletia walkeri]
MIRSLLLVPQLRVASPSSLIFIRSASTFLHSSHSIGLNLTLSPKHRLPSTSILIHSRSTRPSFFSTSPSPRTPPSTQPSPASQDQDQDHKEDVLATYTGPLHKTFRRLKLFSLSSLVFASALTPYLLLGPGSLDTFGRVALVITALSASSASTALISWIGKPYVGTLNLVRRQQSSLKEQQYTDPLPPSDNQLVAYTTSWRLQPLRTTIYQPAYIRGTSRPFAQWQLAATPPALPISDPALYSSSSKVRSLIAETRKDRTGDLVGQYWVEWRPDALSKSPAPAPTPAPSQDADQEQPEPTQPEGEAGAWRMEGICKIEGKPLRHFNVHEELLDDEWRVLE